MYPKVNIDSVNVRPASKAEGTALFAWFMQRIPERVQVLEEQVRSSAHRGHWRADFSPDSFKSLSVWLCENTSTESVEPKVVQSHNGTLWSTSPWELSEDTFARCFDVGVYLGESLVRAAPKLRWDSNIAVARNVDGFGQPSLVGFNDRSSMRPFQVAATNCYGFVRKERPPESLFNSFHKFCAKAC